MPSSRPGTRAITRSELGTKPMNDSMSAKPSAYSGELVGRAGCDAAHACIPIDQPCGAST